MPKDLAIMYDRLMAGDKDVLDDYFNRFYWQLYLCALGILGDQTVAEDIVSEVFVKLHNNRHKMNDPGHVYRWLIVVVQHDAIGYLRKIERQRLAGEEQKYLTADIDEAPTESEKEYAETMDQIHRTIKRLPPGQRRIFELSFYDCLTVREISVALNIEEQTVRNQRNLALGFLREEMAQ
jgi:RNA polymerase sigma factor (sigma-70 family)